VEEQEFIVVGKHEKRDHLENVCLDWKIIGA
jgi:hypothetical protein